MKAQWVTGSPLWGGAAPDAMRAPALLRLTTDTFMDSLRETLDREPAKLADLVAAPTSYRNRPPGAPADWPPPLPQLKLYHALHGHFNLVAASLVCGELGLPDHSVRPGEQVGFVLRRVGADDGEQAWAGHPRSWVPLDAAHTSTLTDGEELLPLFPLPYKDSGTDRQRRMYGGLIPVASSDTYLSGSVGTPVPSEADPRWTEFDNKVAYPFTQMQINGELHAAAPGPLAELTAFMLLDFADILQRFLPQVWQAVVSSTPPVEQHQATLYRDLSATLDGTSGLTWRAGLLAAADQWAAITGEPGSAAVTLNVSAKDSPTSITLLQNDFRAALPVVSTPPPVAPSDLALPKIEPTGTVDHVIRCVYTRPGCPVVISAPSRTFRIAQVLDPDAPARTIRIPLPIDVNISDLRKFRRSVGFMLSNQLRGQLDRVTDLNKALKGELGAQGHWDLGVICQFSIPVITICALVILIMFVFLLNIVFFWSSFFRLCLPAPMRSRS